MGVQHDASKEDCFSDDRVSQVIPKMLPCLHEFDGL